MELRIQERLKRGEKIIIVDLGLDDEFTFINSIKNTNIMRHVINSTVNNKVLLRRKQTIYVQSDKLHNPSHANALNLNIAAYGYCLSPELMKVIQTKSVEDITLLNNFLTETLKVMVGADVEHVPLFRNFPKDVPETFDYFTDRVIGYLENIFGYTENAKLLSCGHLINTEKFDMSNFSACPICQVQLDSNEILTSKERKPLKNKNIQIKEIGLGKSNDVFHVFENLLSTKTSISAQDKEDIQTILVNNITEVQKYFPAIIPHKEVLAFVSTLVLRHIGVYELIQPSIKTATDVLRIAVAMSDGDVSLATNTTFKRFSKPERRFILFLLENCNSIEEDMMRYGKRWIRLGEIIHPSSYAVKYPKCYEAFFKIRNGIKIETFNSITESLMKSNNIIKLIEHLYSRPSELARKLDYLINNSLTESEIYTAIKSFKKGVKSISTPVLLQVMANFKIRTDNYKSIRIIMPKGNMAKMKVLPENRHAIVGVYAKEVNEIIKDELKERFKLLPEMGKVYIDKRLKEYVVPFSQRSASKALHTIVRGSRTSLPADNTIRMFVYWKGHVDLDLSAVILDENFQYKEHISYTNYHGRSGYDATYSGDIQSAPNGASEFIDIDLDSLVKYGARYVVMNIFSYSGQKFNTLDCFAGFMGRSKVKSGDVFEPKTVKQRYDITADGRVSIPMMFDVVARKMIWMDLSKGGRFAYNNIEGHKDNIAEMAGAMAEMANHKANIYELLKLHVKSRGKIVEDKEKADIVFDEYNIPFEFDTIIGKYLI